MRIGRFHANQQDRIGVFRDGVVEDVTQEFESFSDAMARPLDAVKNSGETFDTSEITYLPPIAKENHVFCAGLNYEAHAEESNIAVPERPLIFTKFPQTLVGHFQPILYHSNVTKEIDYEGELAAVIGESARHVAPEDALDFVAGYTVFNDTSARDLQFDLQVGDDSILDWFSGKSMQGTTPCGPYVVVDEIEDPQNLAIESRVNNETLQDDSTSMMISSVSELVSYVSSRVELSPGDIIATGTPEGVGTFQDIQLYAGDTVEVEVEGIGTLKNTVTEV